MPPAHRPLRAPPADHGVCPPRSRHELLPLRRRGLPHRPTPCRRRGGRVREHQTPTCETNRRPLGGGSDHPPTRLGGQRARGACATVTRLLEVGTPLSTKYYLHKAEGESYGMQPTPNFFSQQEAWLRPTGAGVPGLYLAGQDVRHTAPPPVPHAAHDEHDSRTDHTTHRLPRATTTTGYYRVLPTTADYTPVASSLPVFCPCPAQALNNSETRLKPRRRSTSTVSPVRSSPASSAPLPPTGSPSGSTSCARSDCAPC